MPRGSKPGERRGGKKKGTLNKRTLEKLAETAREVQDLRRNGKKLAKEVLQEFMDMAADIAREELERIREAEKAPARGKPKVAEAERARFWIAMECTKGFARALAPFQSPTYKAVVFTDATMPGGGSMGANAANDAKLIEGKVLPSDPQAAARAYQTMMRVVR